MKMITGFIYVAPHIVGTAEKHGYCYDTDWMMFDTREEAQRHGERELEHDDFWVAECQFPLGSVLSAKVVAFYSGDIKRTNMDEVDAINEEFGK